MALYFADTSAWAKLYVQEPGSAYMTQIASQHAIAVAGIAIVELGSALWRKHALDGIEAKVIDNALRDAWTDLAQMRVVPIGAAILRQAVNLIRNRSVEAGAPLRAYDAVQLSCALDLAREAAVAGFLSADRGLNQAAEALGLSAKDPQSP